MGPFSRITLSGGGGWSGGTAAAPGDGWSGEAARDGDDRPRARAKRRAKAATARSGRGEWRLAGQREGEVSCGGRQLQGVREKGECGKRRRAASAEDERGTAKHYQYKTKS